MPKPSDFHRRGYKAAYVSKPGLSRYSRQLSGWRKVARIGRYSRAFLPDVVRLAGSSLPGLTPCLKCVLSFALGLLFRSLMP